MNRTLPIESSSEAVIPLTNGQVHWRAAFRGAVATYWGGGSAGEWQHGHSVEIRRVSGWRQARVGRGGGASVATAAVRKGPRQDGDGNTGGGGRAHLEHVQQCRLACIIETEEQELGMLVQQAQGGEHIVDWSGPVRQPSWGRWSGGRAKGTYTS